MVLELRGVMAKQCLLFQDAPHIAVVTALILNILELVVCRDLVLTKTVRERNQK